jgi:hypothetical protein
MFLIIGDGLVLRLACLTATTNHASQQQHHHTHAYTLNHTSNIYGVISEFQNKSFKHYHTKLNLKS